MGKWQRYFVNPINLTLYRNHLIGAFYLPELFHHLISRHLCAVVYVILVAWHPPYSEEEAARAAESFPEVTTFNLLIVQLSLPHSIQRRSPEGKQKPGLAQILQEELVEPLCDTFLINIQAREPFSKFCLIDFFCHSFCLIDFFPLITLLLQFLFPLLRILACSL